MSAGANSWTSDCENLQLEDGQNSFCSERYGDNDRQQLTALLDEQNTLDADSRIGVADIVI